MKFITDIKEERYVDFCEKFTNSDFLQSYEWGQASKIRGLTPNYVGIEDESENLIAAALLLQKKTPLNMCYFYAPRGLLVDYDNEEVLDFFINSLKQYLKDKNAIYLKFDPAIMYQEIDEDGKVVENGINNYKLFDKLISLGLVHQGFNKLYEKNQPRYTFRIPTNIEITEIEKKFNRSFMRSIKKSYFYEVEIRQSDNIKMFFELIKNNSKKNDFKEYSLKFYETVYKEFNKYNHFTMFEALIYPGKIIKKINEELEKSIPEDQKNKYKKDLEIFKSLEGKYKDGKIICELIMLSTKNRTWAMYIGNDSLAEYTCAVSRVYYEIFRDAISNNYEFVDLFGTPGDPKTTYKNLASLHDYKRKMGGDYIEFIGEFDLVSKPFWYKLLPIILKIYRKIKS